MTTKSDKEYKQSRSDQSVFDIVAGLALATVSLALLFWIIPVHVSHTASQHDISADFFPTATAWTLLALSIALVVDRVVKSTHLRKAITDSSTGIPILLELCAWLAVAVLAYVAIVHVSFYATAIALILGGALACHYRNWPTLIAVSIIAPLLIGQFSWLVFSVKFN